MYTTTDGTAIKCAAVSPGFSLTAAGVVAACAAETGSEGGMDTVTCTACTVSKCAVCNPIATCTSCVATYNLAANACTLFPQATIHMTCASGSGTTLNDCQTCDATTNFR